MPKAMKGTKSAGARVQQMLAAARGPALTIRFAGVALAISLLGRPRRRRRLITDREGGADVVVSA